MKIAKLSGLFAVLVSLSGCSININHEPALPPLQIPPDGRIAVRICDALNCEEALLAPDSTYHSTVQHGSGITVADLEIVMTCDILQFTRANTGQDKTQLCAGTVQIKDATGSANFGDNCALYYSAASNGTQPAVY